MISKSSIFVLSSMEFRQKKRAKIKNEGGIEK